MEPSTWIIFCIRFGLREYRMIVSFDQVDGLYHNLGIFSNSLPWDQRTPQGYFGEVIFDVFMGHAYLFCNFTFLLLFVSICWHHQAFHKMFEHTSRKLNNHDRSRNNTEFVCNLIRYQISVREWVCHHGIENTHFLFFKFGIPFQLVFGNSRIVQPVARNYAYWIHASLILCSFSTW